MVDGLIFRPPGNFAAPVFRPPGGSRYISLKKASQVASTILEQLGGTRRLKAMVGAHSFADHGNGVSFLFPNRQRSRGNSVKITLTPADTYDVDFFNVSIRGAKKVKSYSDLYFDQLQPIFEKQTGLYLRLGAAQKTAYSIPPANQAEWVRIFDGLRAGQTVQVAMRAVMSIGGLFDGEYHDYKVQRRSVSKKYGVESITLQPIGHPKSTRGSRIRLMKRGGKVSVAVGDMAADLHGIKRASASAKAVAARFLGS